MVREIGWTHNLVILEKCADRLEREFYLRMARRMGGDLRAEMPQRGGQEQPVRREQGADGEEGELVFSPHLLPIPRGILSTLHDAAEARRLHARH